MTRASVETRTLLDALGLSQRCHGQTHAPQQTAASRNLFRPVVRRALGDALAASDAADRSKHRRNRSPLHRIAELCPHLTFVVVAFLQSPIIIDDPSRYHLGQAL